MRILIVEDDEKMCGTMEQTLINNGFITETIDMGRDCIDRAKLYEYDALVLDLMLPDIDGFEVIKRLRTSNISTPILVISGLFDIKDKIKCLDTGADDYIVKPFDTQELLSRIQAIVRRSNGHSDSVINIRGLSLNTKTKTVDIDAKSIKLTGKEYSILELLCRRKNSTLTKEMFLNNLYNSADEPDPKIIDVFVCKVRRKIAELTGGDPYIETVWGRGYVLRDQPSDIIDSSIQLDPNSKDNIDFNKKTGL